jgi:hypothetical protein
MSHDQPTVIVDSGASYIGTSIADKLINAKSISEVARLVKEEVIPTLRQQQEEIEYWKEMFEKAMKAREK